MDNDVLRQAPLFSALDDEAASALRTSMTESRLRRGDVLFREGDSGDKLYIVLEGKVKLGRTSADGRENLLAILGPGQMFGELSLFDPGPRSATVTAVTDASFASLSHEDLLRWLEGRPVVARGLLTQLAGRLRKANDVVADLVFSDVPGRVAKALLDLADRFGRTADDGLARLAAPRAPLGGHHGPRADVSPRPLRAGGRKLLEDCPLFPPAQRLSR